MTILGYLSDIYRLFLGDIPFEGMTASISRDRVLRDSFTYRTLWAFFTYAGRWFMHLYFGVSRAIPPRGGDNCCGMPAKSMRKPKEAEQTWHCSAPVSYFKIAVA